METRENIGQTGMLLRNEDGGAVNIEYKNTAIEVDTRTGERGRSKENFTPKFDVKPVVGSLIEIPIGTQGAKYYETTIPMHGQDKSDSVFARKINQETFDRQKSHGVPVVRPSNISQVRAR